MAASAMRRVIHGLRGINGRRSLRYAKTSAIVAISGAFGFMFAKASKEEDKNVEYEPPPYASEDKYSWPGRPGLTRMVADNAKEIAESPKDVFVEFFSPDCHACERFAPVMRHVAYSTKDEKDIVIAQMDVDVNHDESFVSAKDLESLPLVRYFPSNGGRAVDLEGRTNLPEMLKFVHTNAKRPYDKARVEKASEKLLPKTKQRIRKVVKKQMSEDSQMTALEVSPCGKLQIEAMVKLLTSIVSSDEMDFSGMDKSQKCMLQNKENIKEFWEEEY
eukprot:CAMPEP_0167750694 /NCGR_PEP_ID=MMETSP0110_2-20121227/6136_1 /TAXON_ID=629695 /ORGANISM="Gymnochlora sp., Strain CCMP2014" /LENGTH=274 /DNA_ID=CAMNT_0007636049 /DNA_START=122 /DNA_END=946 /DNA_ORIENTATION=-